MHSPYLQFKLRYVYLSSNFIVVFMAIYEHLSSHNNQVRASCLVVRVKVLIMHSPYLQFKLRYVYLSSNFIVV